MIFFYLPFFYSMHTRLTTLRIRVGWIFTYLIPSTLAYVLAGGRNAEALALCIVLIYVVYEWGYIVNDAVLARHEINPTVRLSSDESDYYARNTFEIAAVRGITSLVLLLALWSLAPAPVVTLYGCGIAAIAGIYYIYNRTRSRWTISLYALLVFLRYFLPTMPFVSDPMDIVAMALAYPVLAVFEFCGKPRFMLRTAQHQAIHCDRNRVFYYAALAVIFWVTGLSLESARTWQYLVLYFLLYRVVFFLIRKKMR